MVFDSSVTFHYTGADSVYISSLHAALKCWARVSKESLCGPPSTWNHTITLQPLTCHGQIWPLWRIQSWRFSNLGYWKKAKEGRAKVKWDAGHVPLRLDAVLHGASVTFPLIQSQDIYIAPASFDHSGVDSCSTDTGTLDTPKQKGIL